MRYVRITDGQHWHQVRTETYDRLRERHLVTALCTECPKDERYDIAHPIGTWADIKIIIEEGSHALS